MKLPKWRTWRQKRESVSAELQGNPQSGEDEVKGHEKEGTGRWAEIPASAASCIPSEAAVSGRRAISSVNGY